MFTHPAGPFGTAVGIEVAVSMLEADLVMAWYGRLGQRGDNRRFWFSRSRIRGLLVALAHLQPLLRGRRKLYLPITRGR